MRSFLSVLMITALGVFLVAGSASALSLRLTEGANVVTIDDNGTGDMDGAVGAIVFNGAVGVFNFNMTTGLSNPILGTPSSVVMDLNSVNISGGTGTLLLELTDTDFLLTSPLVFNAGIGGTTTGTVDFYETWGDPGNAPFAQTALITSVGSFGTGVFAGSAAASMDTLAAPFSLTQVVQFTHVGGVGGGDVCEGGVDGGGVGITSFNAELQGAPTPEPATLLLFGSGLVGFAGFGRKFRK